MRRWVAATSRPAWPSNRHARERASARHLAVGAVEKVVVMASPPSVSSKSARVRFVSIKPKKGNSSLSDFAFRRLVHPTPRANAHTRTARRLDDSRPPWTPSPDHLVRCAATEHRRPYATPGTLTASDQPLARHSAPACAAPDQPPARGRPWRSAPSRRRRSSSRPSGSATRAGQRPRGRTLPRTSCLCEGAPQTLTLTAIAILGPEP